jgi:hypothetical protein
MVKYNLWSKLRQLAVYLRPVDKRRYGKCKRCGACCKFMFRCPFLKYVNGKAACKIQPVKWWTCSKYPLNEKEHHTRDVCGYKFRK